MAHIDIQISKCQSEEDGAELRDGKYNKSISGSQFLALGLELQVRYDTLCE